MTTLVQKVEVPDVSSSGKITLRVADRCDAGRCGAQALVVTDHDGNHLLWCKHHFEQHEADLAPLVVLDDRKILTRPV